MKASKVFLRVFSGIIGLAVIVIGGMLIYVFAAKPDAGPPPEMNINTDEEMIARGKYLATNVSQCMSCHSDRDKSRFGGPVIPGSEGKGGILFGPEEDFPGHFYAQNITPYHLGDWTDGDIYHAMAAGVNKKGTPLFPIMPYHSYGIMDMEDAKAVIAYIRTLDKIEHQVPESEASFPMNIIMRMMPSAPQPMIRPDPSDKVKYGEYLTTIAVCGDCHTPREKGRPVPELAFSGGNPFIVKGGMAYTANITPDDETGIGTWSEDFFVEYFKNYDRPFEEIDKVKKGEFNTSMPWKEYAGMTDEDLRAIYAYLRTVKPVKNSVVKFVPDKKEVAQK
ncbi:MAG: c-type cytochrome [Bacteroidota bacterium]